MSQQSSPPPPGLDQPVQLGSHSMGTFMMVFRGWRARPRWGWHRLHRSWARRVVADAGVMPGELVLDIGAGYGSLTQALVDAGARVVAVELQRQRAQVLRERFAGLPVTVVQADACDLRLPRRPFRVVDNPPFAVVTHCSAGCSRRGHASTPPIWWCPVTWPVAGSRRRPPGRRAGPTPSVCGLAPPCPGRHSSRRRRGTPGSWSSGAAAGSAARLERRDGRQRLIRRSGRHQPRSEGWERVRTNLFAPRCVIEGDGQTVWGWEVRIGDRSR